MAFPVTSVIETFTGDNGTSPPNANWTNGLGQLTIQGNQATSDSSYCAAFWDTATFGPDSECFITLATASGAYSMLYLRYTGFPTATADGYALSVYGSTPYTWTIQSVTNGTPTTIATGTQQVVSGEKIGFRIIGNVLSAYHYTGGAWNQTPIATGTDSGNLYPNAGYIGCGCSNTIYRLDDFGGGDSTVDTITRVVDPDAGTGYNYDSLSDWEADLGDTTSGNLPVYGEIAIAKCRCTGGTADTGNISIDGWTTDATHYIKIWTDPAENYRHNGTYQTGNKYRIEYTTESAYTYGIQTIESFVRIEGVPIKITYGHGSTSAFSAYPNAACDIRFISCIAYGIATADSVSCIGYEQGGGSNSLVVAINCIAYGFKDTNNSSGVGFQLACPNSSYKGRSYNCTAYDCRYGFYDSQYEQYILINCLAQDCTTCYSGTWVTGCSNNCSDDNTQPGSSGRNGEVSFVAEGSGNFHLDASDTGAKGYGLNLYNDATYPFQTDIDGQDRGASWDIGADEYVRTVRLRFLLDAAGDPAAAQFQLEYRYKPNEGSWGNWAIVPESEP